MAMLNVTANSRNSRPTMPPISRMGMKTEINEVLIDSTVGPISLEPFRAACKRRIPGLQIPRDIFDHNNGVVDDEPRHDRQRHQGEIVDAVPEQIHDSKRADERKRHRNARNHRRPDVAQEQENNHDDQRDGEHQRELNILDRCADRAACDPKLS